MPDFLSPLIYAVDDDEDDRYLLQRIFSEHFKQCTLRTFDNGAALLTQLTHQLDGRLPDQIILDLKMPIFSGFELLRFLKQNDTFCRIPISILSGLHYDDHGEQCIELGITSYLNKTQSYIQLVANIRHLQHQWTEARFPKSRLPNKVVKVCSGIDLEKLSIN